MANYQHHVNGPPTHWNESNSAHVFDDELRRSLGRINRRWIAGVSAPDLNGMLVAYSWIRDPLPPHNLLMGVGIGGRSRLIQLMVGVDADIQVPGRDEDMVLLHASFAVQPIRPHWGGFRTGIWFPDSVTRFDPSVATFAEHPGAKYPKAKGVGKQNLAAYVAAAFANSPFRTVIAFVTVPGHGTCLVERWVDDKEPFEPLMDAARDGLLTFGTKPPNRRLYYVRKTDAAAGRPMMLVRTA